MLRNRAGEGLTRTVLTENRGEVLLRLEEIGIRFGGLQALEGIDMELKRGEFVGLIGPNGAGKTTLFSIISGLQRQTTGRVTLFGEPLPTGHEIVRRGMARTFQHVQLMPELSVIENVALGAYCRTDAGFIRGLFALDEQENRQALASARAALERVGLSAEVDLAAGSLPLGKQRIVEIARALVADPQILLLDEPAAGLNPKETQEIDELIRSIVAAGTTVVLVEHNMKLVMGVSNHILVLDYGRRLAEGTAAEVGENPDVVRAYLGAGAERRA
jgi:ABC-type branched-subunit amino acid transport system ATPase component